VSAKDFLDDTGHLDSAKIMGVFQAVVDYLAPLFLIASPVTSYADQIVSIHRSKTSAGFSLDIPLIMLLASILKVFYWFGEHYDTALLVQAMLMIAVQITLLKVALDNRPPSGEKNGLQHIPFAGHSRSALEELLSVRRPYDFWRWSNSKSYFVFLGYFAGSLAVIQILLPWLAYSPAYVGLLGYTGLAIEATLPLPQIYKNHSARSCKGFRVSVIINWLMGDAMKMCYFFGAASRCPGRSSCVVCSMPHAMRIWVCSFGCMEARGGVRGTFRWRRRGRVS